MMVVFTMSCLSSAIYSMLEKGGITDYEKALLDIFVLMITQFFSSLSFSSSSSLPCRLHLLVAQSSAKGLPGCLQ